MISRLDFLSWSSGLRELFAGELMRVMRMRSRTNGVSPRISKSEPLDGSVSEDNYNPF